jgi:hypothetical protein
MGGSGGLRGGILRKSGMATLSRCRPGGGAWHSLLTIPLRIGEQISMGWRGGCRMRQDTWRTCSSSPRAGNAAYPVAPRGTVNLKVS